ncbi:MAG: hypothetical protein FGF53_06875 [Candidatus Brockarchaeota archaeon]|nr:hypothetical protein [Candidatus Brockarchaeota archaeon]MBO3809471.1 hypothetical protein [Candidatus Brockarchaeota archaeon]
MKQLREVNSACSTTQSIGKAMRIMSVKSKEDKYFVGFHLPAMSPKSNPATTR